MKRDQAWMGESAAHQNAHPLPNCLHRSWKTKPCSLTYGAQLRLNTGKPIVKGTVQSDASHNNFAPIKPSDYCETSCDLSANPK